MGGGGEGGGREGSTVYSSRYASMSVAAKSVLSSAGVSTEWGWEVCVREGKATMDRLYV